jgi:hypothetical protein
MVLLKALMENKIFNHSDRLDKILRDSSGDVKIVTDIEGGNVYNVKKLATDHFDIQMKPDIPFIYRYPDHQFYWFYFKMKEVRGKEIKIEITNCDWLPRHWKKYKPVYSYADDPDALTGVTWHRIEKTKYRWHKFSFTQRYDKDAVWVALRYPYNYSRQKKYLEAIRGKEHVDIEVLGRTAANKPLYMIVVTDKGIPDSSKKGVLVYAREHGVEQDGSWVAEGMIDALLSSELYADTLRRHLVFMFVPILTPDAAVAGSVVDPLTGKYPGIELINDNVGSVEAGLLLKRLQWFVDNGNTIDICISLHNPHGTEPNIYPHYRPYKDIGRLTNAKKLHQAVLNNSNGYSVWKEFNRQSCLYSVGRFARDFDAVSIVYEINHQAENNYLTLEKLKGIGKVFLKGIKDYFNLMP